MEKFFTDYRTAAHWNCTLIECNKLPEIDPSIFENAEFNFFVEDENGEEIEIDIFQYFITDLNFDDVQYMQRTFPDLKYTYSDLLDCWVLCVDHFGTPWHGIPCRVASENWIDCNRDKEYKI